MFLPCSLRAYRPPTQSTPVSCGQAPPGLHDQIRFPSSSFLPSLELRLLHSELAHPEWARYLEGD